MIYRRLTGALVMPSWHTQLLVAHVRYNTKTRKVSVTWIDHDTAMGVLRRAARRFCEGRKIQLLANQHGELCGYRSAKHRCRVLVPVAYRATKDVLGTRRKATLSPWDHGADALIEKTIFAEDLDEIGIAYVSGAQAWESLMLRLCDPTATPLGAPDSVYGVEWRDLSREEYWDNSEQDYDTALPESDVVTSGE